LPLHNNQALTTPQTQLAGIILPKNPPENQNRYLSGSQSAFPHPPNFAHFSQPRDSTQLDMFASKNNENAFQAISDTAEYIDDGLIGIGTDMRENGAVEEKRLTDGDEDNNAKLEEIERRKKVEGIAKDIFNIQNLKNSQWAVINSIVFEGRDTILNAPTGFGKNLPFQFLPLVSDHE
jgi:hypothetical protein